MYFLEFLIDFLHEVINGISLPEITEAAIQNLVTQLSVLVCGHGLFI